MNNTVFSPKNPKTFQAANIGLKAISEAVVKTSSYEAECFANEVKRIACILMVTKGKGYYSSPIKVSEMLPDKYKSQWLMSRREVRKITGGWKCLIKLLDHGNVLPPGLMGRWTPDFLNGLKRAGGFKRNNRGFWFTPMLGDRPALRAAFIGGTASLPFHCTAKAAPANGDCLCLAGCWALEIGADNPEGIGVVAGLLAGGRRLVYDKQSWVVITNAGSNAALLSSYGIPFRVEHLGHRSYGQLLVSPFWGALLSSEMPKVFGDWFENWEQRSSLRPGMYPLLPWVFLRAVWRVGVCDNSKPKGLVPFLTDRNTLLTTYGIGQHSVMEEGLKRFGFTRVDARVRLAWLKRLKDRGITAESFSSERKIPTGLIEVLNSDLG